MPKCAAETCRVVVERWGGVGENEMILIFVVE